MFGLDGIDEQLPYDNAADEDVLKRASARISEILPKRLRFSEAWSLRRDLAIAAAEAQGVGQRKCATADSDSQHLRVFVRLRPQHVKGVVGTADGVAIQAVSDTELVLHPPQNDKRVLKPLPSETFAFTRVLPAITSQQDCFTQTTLPLVSDLTSFKATNSVIMAFGSSGAGKTHTMLGTEAEPGILPRSICQVFKDLQGLPHKVLVSYYEVYNDLVNDLLDGYSCSHHSRAGSSGPSQPSGTASSSTSQPTASLAGGASGEPAPQQQRQDRWQAGKAPLRHALLQPREPARPVLRIREDPQGRVVIPRLSEVVCHSAEQALELQRRAAKLRQQAATGVNSTSSRSHCVFTIKVLESPGGPGEGPGAAWGRGAGSCQPSFRTAQLSYVDLAGSERAARTKNAAGVRMKESVSINTSLMTLGRCLEALKANQAAGPQRIIPYRESKITHLFRDVLHGYGHLVLLVAASPCAADVEETHHVLRYAALATSIKMRIGASSQPCAPLNRLPPPPKLGDSAGNVGPHAPSPSAVASDTATDAAVQQLSSRVQQLEQELERVCGQLSEAEAALAAAEADLRDEIVAEIEEVMRELRAGYEERLASSATALGTREAEVALLRAQLTEAQHSHGQRSPLQAVGRETGEQTLLGNQVQAQAQLTAQVAGLQAQLVAQQQAAAQREAQAAQHLAALAAQVAALQQQLEAQGPPLAAELVGSAPPPAQPCTGGHGLRHTPVLAEPAAPSLLPSPEGSNKGCARTLPASPPRPRPVLCPESPSWHRQAPSGPPPHTTQPGSSPAAAVPLSSRPLAQLPAGSPDLASVPSQVLAGGGQQHASMPPEGDMSGSGVPAGLPGLPACGVSQGCQGCVAARVVEAAVQEQCSSACQEPQAGQVSLAQDVRLSAQGVTPSQRLQHQGRGMVVEGYEELQVLDQDTASTSSTQAPLHHPHVVDCGGQMQQDRQMEEQQQQKEEQQQQEDQLQQQQEDQQQQHVGLHPLRDIGTTQEQPIEPQAGASRARKRAARKHTLEATEAVEGLPAKRSRRALRR